MNRTQLHAELFWKCIYQSQRQDHIQTQGNFGISYQLKRPVSELISERMPATLELVFVSALLAISVGVLLGVYTGIHRDSFLSKVI